MKIAGLLLLIVAIFADAEERPRHMKVTETNMASAGKLGTIYSATFKDADVVMPLACTTKLNDGNDNADCRMPIVGEQYEVRHYKEGWYVVTGPDEFFAEMLLGAWVKDAK